MLAHTNLTSVREKVKSQRTPKTTQLLMFFAWFDCHWSLITKKKYTCLLIQEAKKNNTRP